jgi:1-acyl-sn-glycerol-3-phosphate acyltransferase
LSRDVSPRGGGRADPSGSESSAPGPAFVGDQGLREGIFYSLCTYLSRLALASFFEVRVWHVDRVPRTGPVLLAPNHASFLDPWIVGSTLSRRPVFLARDSLFRVPILGPLIGALSAVPVPRESVAPRAALELCIRVLREGRLLLLFPEGTRTPDGRLQPLQKGCAWIARKAGAPVVPARIFGSFEAWPRGASLPNRFPIRVVYGMPLRYEVGESSESFLDRLHLAISSLGFEECGDEAFGPGGMSASTAPLAPRATEPASSL